MKTLKNTLMTIAMLLCSTTVSAHNFEVDGIYYNITSITDLTVEVTYKGPDFSSLVEYFGTVTIPQTVTFNGNTYSVTAIGEYAFSSCDSLISVTIPASITSIGENAFRVTGINCITIPNSVTSIGDGAFAYCQDLEEIKIPNLVKKIGAWTFEGCSNLISVDMPNTVESIGAYAFQNCKNLETLSLPQSLRNISSCTFRACSSLSQISIPSSVTSIGDYAFDGCSNLVNITIPQSVENIEWDAFSGCGLLPTENNIRYADTWAVGVTDRTLESYDLRSNTTGLATSLFSGCYNLTEITIPDSVEIIERNVFLGCTGLFNVVIGKSVKEIRQCAFKGCTNLINIIIPSSVTKIYPSIVYFDPIGMCETTDEGTFYGCSNLINVTVESPKIALLDELHAITFWAPDGTEVEELHNVYFKDIFGDQVTNYILGDKITAIGDGAFCECANLRNVTFPKNITSIGSSMFSGCIGLDSINIPNSVTSIGDYAFSGCTGLDSIKISNSVTSIGDYAFYNCTALKYICSEALVPPTCETTTFDGIDTENCILEVPASAVNAYATTAPWSEFNIKVSLVDGENYENETDTEIGVITYTRTLNNQLWNALYVPFEIPVSQLIENYDIAYINAMHSYDMDDNGAIDKMEMEVVKIKEGTLHANYPYLIRAKNEEAKAMEIVVENSTLYAAESVTVDCSSVFTKFEITGTYQPLTNEEIDGCRALSDGTWKTMPEDATLNPFRLYLRISDREGSPVKVDTYALEQTSVTIRVQGENPGTTSIESEEIRVKNEESDATIYNLMGQPVKNPVKGHIYIQGGRKVVW